MSCYLMLDGPDGCGKTSQSAALVSWLRGRGHQVQHVREPGSTPVGEALRRLLLANETGELQPLTEALLFSAARAELVANVVAPALANGDIVVAERGYLSTLVYQGLAVRAGDLAMPAGAPGALSAVGALPAAHDPSRDARQHAPPSPPRSAPNPAAHPARPAALTAARSALPLDWLLDLTRRVHGHHQPDAVFVLDVPEAIARQRRATRTDDRIEARPAGFHERVRRSFVAAAALDPRIRLLDAARPFDVVQHELQQAVVGLLP